MRMRSLKKQGGWIGGALVAGAILYGGKRASDRAKNTESDNKRLIQETTKLIEIERDEDIRKMRLVNKQVEGEVAARIAASGFTPDSQSFVAYQDELESEFRNQIQWRKKQARQEKRVVQQGGEYQRAGMKAQRYSANANTITTAIGAFFGAS